MHKRINIVISGASGLLGSELIRQLSNNSKCNVLALTSQKTKLEEQTKEFGNVFVIQNDDFFQSDFQNQIDVLLNCAFTRKLNGSALASSLDFSAKLIKQAVGMGVKSIINISSQSVYSRTRKQPASEKTSVNPDTMYGIAKYANELLISSICNQHMITHTNIRLASLVGTQFSARLVNRMVDNALNTNRITVNGGDQIISYLGLKDAARGLIAIAISDKKNWNNIYNLGSTEAYSLNEIAKLIKALVEKNTSQSVDITRLESEDFINMSLDSQEFFSAFAWLPEDKLEDIILNIIRNQTSAQ